MERASKKIHRKLPYTFIYGEKVTPFDKNDTNKIIEKHVVNVSAKNKLRKCLLSSLLCGNKYLSILA